MKRVLRCATSTLALIAGIAAVSVPMVYACKDNAVPSNEGNMTVPVDPVVECSINAGGQTYGLAIAESIEDLPDLVAVVGDNGKTGYVYADELFDAPKTPDEATKYQEARQEAIDNGTYAPKVYDVYEADGKTVIDTFTEAISR